jgi:serine protease
MERKTARPRKPRRQDSGVYQPRVVVKFQDYVSLPYEEGVESELEARSIGAWSEVADHFPGIHLTPLYRELKPEQIREMVEAASQRDRAYKPPNLLTYFAVDCPPGVEPDALAKALDSWRSVEEAYVEAGPTIPPQVNALDDPRQVNQGYEDAAPGGIGAEFAWTVPGGDGAGIQFVDLEQGWTLNHEDLAAAGITIISGVSNAYHGHGTAVLGEVVAVDNTLGNVGIATNAGARVVSQWQTASTWNTADAIISATAALGFGDVLLLEAQTTAPGWTFLPVEIETAVYDAIRLATALGVVVVEAAGNGGNDLDTFTAGGVQILNRASAGFRDSGAIMVGAASASAPHTRLGFSNFGSRIDCYGWGENVDTTGDGWTGTSTTAYTPSFGGTSSASPIVAGAAISVQGMAQAQLGYRFTPRTLRAILSDPATGTASATPATDRIGVMPNLNAIVTGVLNAIEDVYVRDHVGDSGDPHSGPISASPDIIARPSPVSNPQAAFGQGSGTENDDALGFEVEAGQDNYIYVRTRNRGGVGATNVVATVYWAPVATLVTPNLWTLIDSVTIPSVPTGNQLTVSDAIVWPAASIPASGHYCFVGLVGTAADPAPGLAAFSNWSNFTTFISANNNVTWRNFNVVNNVPPSGGKPPGFVQLPFLAPGAPDEARPFVLEVIARLPEGARILLEAPLYLLEGLEERAPLMETESEHGRGRLPVNPRGRFTLGEVLFPAESRPELRLLVEIPKKLRENAYDVVVRQLYQRQEVGRVTWRLAPMERERREEDRPKRARNKR